MIRAQFCARKSLIPSKTLGMDKLRMGLSAALCGLLLAGALSSCDKWGFLWPPEGEERSDTYPRIYPNPASVLPKTEVEEWKTPAHVGDISIWPNSRTKTTYGPGVIQ